AAAQRGDPGQAAVQHALAASYQALEQAYRQRETVFTQTMADRADWDAATRAQRQLAVAADAELHRAIPASPSPRCGPPNPSPPPQPSAADSPHPRPAAGPDRPVDKGSCRRAPDLCRSARRPAQPDDPVRGPRLRRSRPGVPRLDQPRPG